MTFLLLHTFTVFSSFQIIVGDVLQRTSAVAIDQLVTGGEQFVKRIVHGEKLTEIPGYLLFTAPLQLCKGGCNDGESNFAMAFPIYIGKKGVDKYKNLYNRDYNSSHTINAYAPFKKRPTKKLFTLCQDKITEQQKTTTESEATITKTPTNDFETETFFTEASTTFKETLENETTEIEAPTDFPITTIPTVSKIETTETETEDITFESSENKDALSFEDEEYTYVTNAKGLRCPIRTCKNKKKATAPIILLKGEKEILDESKWNSDY